jgi:hypothetical protein
MINGETITNIPSFKADVVNSVVGPKEQDLIKYY